MKSKSMSDTTDDLDWGGDFYPEICQANREEEWARGIHTTMLGDIILLKDMGTSHIKNTIRYFEDYDTSPLKKELERRLTH